MSDPFVAEVRIFPFYFAPAGWAFCDGQLLPISQNTALFSLLGTFYGGDGKSTFALPDMQGNAPINSGQGPGLTERFLGEAGGIPSVTLLTSEIPVHTHSLMATTLAATQTTPANNVPAKPLWTSGTTIGQGVAYSTETPDQTMSPDSLAPSGGSLPHNNMQPFLTLNFCIAMAGVFPPRT